MQPNRLLHRCAPGPWGEIEYFFTFLDPPSSYFNGLLSHPATQWFFAERTRPQVAAILETCGIDSAKISGSWIQEGVNGVMIEPPDSFLTDLPVGAVHELHRTLLRLYGDESSLSEFVIENGDFASFAEGLNLPEEMIRWTEDRCFKMGTRTLFADTQLGLSHFSDVQGKIRYLTALSRTRSMMARLRITAESDLKRIAEWWSGGPNHLRPLPLLEAALATRGVDTIDLIHLLPPGAKRVLNTFALERDCFRDQAPDCYWAAMNFFRSSPSNRFLDVEIPRSYYFVDRFEKVPKASRFGDVVVLVMREENRFIHAFVHIAEDIVYTKNGSSKFYPYVLMKRKDMMSRYLPEGDYVIDIFRLRKH